MELPSDPSWVIFINAGVGAKFAVVRPPMSKLFSLGG